MKKLQIANITTNAVSRKMSRPVAGTVTFSDDRTFNWATDFGWNGTDYAYGDNVNIFIYRKLKHEPMIDPVGIKLPRNERHQLLEEYLKGDNLPEPQAGSLIFD